jgi:hypothetical protein
MTTDNGDYPAGAQFDPMAPFNQRDEDFEFEFTVKVVVSTEMAPYETRDEVEDTMRMDAKSILEHALSDTDAEIIE